VPWRAERDEAMQFRNGRGRGRGSWSGEDEGTSKMSVKLHSGLFCYRCWEVKVGVVDFSRQRRSTRWLRRLTEEPT
jgi:hypothetical protein